jgi:hypothetical protein
MPDKNKKISIKFDYTDPDFLEASRVSLIASAFQEQKKYYLAAIYFAQTYLLLEKCLSKYKDAKNITGINPDHFNTPLCKLHAVYWISTDKERTSLPEAVTSLLKSKFSPAFLPQPPQIISDDEEDQEDDDEDMGCIPPISSM